MQQLPRRESLRAERRNIEQARLTFKDQFGDDAAGRGRVHDAVTAEAVGEVEAADVGRRADDRVMVGRHLVESGPSAARIDLRFGEAGHTRGGVRENLLDE